MKLKSLLPTAVLLSIASPALACLQVTGKIVGNGIYSATVVDNGLTVCNAAWGWRVDQDDHFSLTCISPYIYAVTRNGGLAWYRNPATAFSFTQNTSPAGRFTIDFWTSQFGC